MWSQAAINAAWSRTDELDPAALLAFENVREWTSSSPDRTTDFHLLLKRAQEDLLAWEVDRLGVLPSGVGGLCFAGRRISEEVVAKWVGPTEANELRVLSARMLEGAGIGPSVLAWSETGLLTRRVLPGIPLRSTSPPPDAVVATAERLALLQQIELPRGYRLPCLRSWTKGEFGVLQRPTHGNPFTQAVAEVSIDQLPTSAQRLAHGDMQLGNALTSHRGIQLIDGLALVDVGHFDAARLVVHSFVDASGRGDRWNLARLIERVAAVLGIPENDLASYARARAVLDGYRVYETLDREWEWKGYLQVIRDLE